MPGLFPAREGLVGDLATGRLFHFALRKNTYKENA